MFIHSFALFTLPLFCVQFCKSETNEVYNTVTHLRISNLLLLSISLQLGFFSTYLLFVVLLTWCMWRFDKSCFLLLLPVMCVTNNGDFTCCRNEVKQYKTFRDWYEFFVCVSVAFSCSMISHINNVAVCIINSPAMVFINSDSPCTAFSRHNAYSVLLATLYNKVITFIERVTCIECNLAVRWDYMDCVMCTLNNATTKSLLKSVMHSLWISSYSFSSSFSCSLFAIDEVYIVY